MKKQSALTLLALACLSTSAWAQVRHLGIRAPDGESTIAFDVNQAGQVAAVLQNDDGRQRGVLFDQGVLTELKLKPGGFSDTKAINSKGQVTGSSEVEAGGWRAYIHQPGAGMRELGTLGGRSSMGGRCRMGGRSR